MSTHKNILFLEQFSTISGGQRVLLNILGGLDRSRYHPYVVLPSVGEMTEELKEMDINYFLLPIGTYSAGKKSLFDILKYVVRSFILIFLTLRIIKKCQIHLIYANAPRTFLWATVAAKLSRIPIIWHLHSILSGIELKISRTLLKSNAQKMITVSQSVAHPFLRSDFSLSSKIEVVYNGIELHKFLGKEKDEKFCQEFNLQSDYKIVGYIGQMAKWKGVENFIRAAELILKKEEKVLFVLVGDVLFGGKKEIAYRDYLRFLAYRLGIESNVIFAGRRENIPGILAVFDILVIPSIEPDPFPLVLLEAMASGKAIVSSSHGGPAEVIEDGISGKLFPPGDEQALASSILFLLQNEEFAQRLGTEAQRKVQEHFSLSPYLEKISHILEEALSANG